MWARIANAVLGVWLMVAAAVLSYGDPARTNDQIFGPIAFAVAVVSIWEVTRGVRWVNLALGLWLVVAPWLLGYGTEAVVNSTVVGLLLIALATVRGKVEQRFGGGWPALWRGSGDEGWLGGRALERQRDRGH